MGSLYLLSGYSDGSLFPLFYIACPKTLGIGNSAANTSLTVYWNRSLGLFLTRIHPSYQFGTYYTFHDHFDLCLVRLCSYFQHENFYGRAFSIGPLSRPWNPTYWISGFIDLFPGYTIDRMYCREPGPYLKITYQDSGQLRTLPIPIFDVTC